MMKVAVVGSRKFKHEFWVRQLVANLTNCTIVSGGAGGPDSWAIDEATKRNMETEVLPADWEKHGKAAGMLRNTAVVNLVDVVVAFWDGESRGTHDTIKKAIAAGKPVHVFLPTMFFRAREAEWHGRQIRLDAQASIG